MVNDRLHIICGNCGQDLKEKNMSFWQYVPAIFDNVTNEEIHKAEVLIHCENCATIHFLSKYMKEISECEGNDE